MAASSGSQASGESADAPQSPPLDDPVTERAVDDIVHHEGDEVLAAEDAAREQSSFRPPKHSVWRSIGHVFGVWLGTAWGRWITFFVVLAVAGTCAGVPAARYLCLNQFGVRSTASVTVNESLLGTPLKNVQVALAGQTAKTDAKGVAHFTNLVLGPTTLRITEIGFGTSTQQVVVGWGSNPLGPYSLRSTGVAYRVLVRDAITGQPLAGAEAVIGDASALSDKSGNMALTLASSATTGGTITVGKSGYRSEQFVLQAPGPTTNISLLPSQKDIFVAKASGIYNLYKSDLDGNNRQLLLAGTGNETTGALALAMSPDGSHAAFVSTRDTQRAPDGNSYNTLTLITIADGTAVELAHAKQLRLIDWIGSKLIFEQVGPSNGTSNASVVSYDYATNSRAQLAAADQLATVLSAQGTVYYGTADGLFKINPDGSGKQQTITQAVTAAVRTDYNTLAVQTGDTWNTYIISSDAVTLTATLLNPSNRLYLVDPAGMQAAWAQNGTLANHAITTGKDSTLVAADVTQPMAWVGSGIVVYQVGNGSMPADYAVSAAGGTPHKINDVVPVAGFSIGQ
ncbi:MAG TPA: hypothetical protein VJP80_07250 [Candidatus Saccharimonadales bacterium]|nr:hypothetical protein [Candidatus Saccharimonadales bacterium]